VQGRAHCFSDNKSNTSFKHRPSTVYSVRDFGFFNPLQEISTNDGFHVVLPIYPTNSLSSQVDIQCLNNMLIKEKMCVVSNKLQ